MNEHQSPYKQVFDSACPDLGRPAYKMMTYPGMTKKETDAFVERAKKSGYSCQESGSTYFLVRTGCPRNYNL